MTARHVAALLLLLGACARTGLAVPEGGPRDAGTAATAETWVYVNDCRALSDYFLVRETTGECLIVAFADRFAPAEGERRTEVAEVSRGPAPCPPPNETVAGYPEARAEVDVEVERSEGELIARVAGTFPDGSAFALDFASADTRSCCGCFGAVWPVGP
ncbi:MAG: hypothetical protein AAF447_18620 [Myxococcota bacterium]